MKANPSLGVCQLIAREREAGAEVASSGELAVARAAGFEPEDIVFAGPGKTDDELRRVVEEGIFADNVESLGEIDRLARIAAGGGEADRGRAPHQPHGPAHGLADAHGRDGRAVRHGPGRARGGGREDALAPRADPARRPRLHRDPGFRGRAAPGALPQHLRDSARDRGPRGETAGDDRLRRRLRGPLLREDVRVRPRGASAKASGSCSRPTGPTRASRGAASSSSSGATSWPTQASTSRGPST